MATNAAGSMPATAGMVPQRTYATGMGVALCGILMFFMALVSAYIVRKGFSNDWQPLEIPRVLWLSTLILLTSSFTIVRARSRLLTSDDSSFRRWWGITAILGIFFLVGLGVGQLAAARRQRDRHCDESQHQLFLRADRGAWVASVGRIRSNDRDRIPLFAASHARDGHESRFHILACHERAVAPAVCIPDGGEVR